MTTASELPSYDALPAAVDAAFAAITEPPTYSTQPNSDEETMAYSPRAGLAIPEGNYIKRWPQAILSLRDQDPGVRLPTYGRGGSVMGELELTSTDRVVCVSVKFLGQLSVFATDSGTVVITTFSQDSVLWKHNPEQTDAGHDSRCPSTLPLYLPIPSTYELNGREYRMPPSFESTCLAPAMFVRVLYTLSVTITRSRSWNPASWTTSKTYHTLINYRPRTRPARPVVMLDTVFASIKPAPEEWTQIVARMNVRDKFTGMAPIDCQLFVPSIQTYAVTDTIPFHLQLVSSLVSLRELIPSSSSILLPQDACSSSRPALHASLARLAPIVVSITRQVAIEANGKRHSRTIVIGQGKLWPVPPSAVAAGTSASGSPARQADARMSMDYASGTKRLSWRNKRSSLSSNLKPRDIYRDSNWGGMDGMDEEDSKEITLDWRGEVKCWPEITVGGFAASNLWVKDFLVLTLTPPNPRSSFLVPLQLSHPIRLVTDPWVDNEELHPQDR